MRRTASAGCSSISDHLRCGLRNTARMRARERLDDLGRADEENFNARVLSKRLGNPFEHNFGSVVPSHCINGDSNRISMRHVSPFDT